MAQEEWEILRVKVSDAKPAVTATYQMLQRCTKDSLAYRVQSGGFKFLKTR